MADTTEAPASTTIPSSDVGNWLTVVGGACGCGHLEADHDLPGECDGCSQCDCERPAPAVVRTANLLADALCSLRSPGSMLGVEDQDEARQLMLLLADRGVRLVRLAGPAR